jgi:hypothetical protein
MVMRRVKSISMAQCCKLVYFPISPTPFGVLSTLQEVLPYNVLQVSSLSRSTIFYVFATFTSFYNFSSALSSLILKHTSQIIMSLQNNFESKEVQWPFSPFVFCWKQPIVFGLILHFFKHLVPFMMALLLYIHMEAIIIHQWLRCTLIFSIHPNAIITIFLFILHPSSCLPCVL